MLGGQRIGKVPRSPVLNDKFNGVIIPLEIYHDIKIPKDAKFSIGTAGLLGDSFIEIRPTGAHTTEYIAPGTHLGEDNVSQKSGMSALADTASDLSKKVDETLADIKSAIGDLRVSFDRVNNGALSKQSMEDLKSTIAHLNSVMARLDEKTFNDDTSKDVKSAVTSFREAADSLNNSVKKLEPAVAKADSVMTKLDSAAGKVDAVMTSTNTAVNSANTAVQDFDKVAKILGKGKGDGLLPALLNDGDLKTEFQMLISNLRKHGVLWYSDEAGDARKKQQEAAEKARQEQLRSRQLKR